MNSLISLTLTLQVIAVLVIHVPGLSTLETAYPFHVTYGNKFDNRINFLMLLKNLPAGGVPTTYVTYQKSPSRNEIDDYQTTQVIEVNEEISKYERIFVDVELRTGGVLCTKSRILEGRNETSTPYFTSSAGSVSDNCFEASECCVIEVEFNYECKANNALVALRRSTNDKSGKCKASRTVNAPAPSTRPTTTTTTPRPIPRYIPPEPRYIPPPPSYYVPPPPRYIPPPPRYYIPPPPRYIRRPAPVYSLSASCSPTKTLLLLAAILILFEVSDVTQILK